MALAEKLGPTGVQPWIRIDGPYGVHNFDFRRYPVLVLVGGGVGITPVIGKKEMIHLLWLTLHVCQACSETFATSDSCLSASEPRFSLTPSSVFTPCGSCAR